MEEMKLLGHVAPALDPDIVRMTFVSLAMMPMLLKNIFEEQMDRAMDVNFLEKLAAFNGYMFSMGLTQAQQAS